MSSRTRNRRSALSTLAGCLGFWLASARVSVEAQLPEPSSYSLSWVRDEGADACITSAKLARALEALVGPILRSASEAERSIEGLVQHELGSSRWHVRIRVLDREGRELGMRELDREASDCRLLDRSILLVTALAVAPAEENAALARLALEEEPGPRLLSELEQQPPTPVVAAVAAPNDGVAEPTRASERRRSRLRPHTPRMLSGELALAGAAAFALLPTTRPGARLSGRLRMPWRLSATLALQYFSRSEAAAYGPGSAAFYATDSTLSACAAPVLGGRFRFDLCGGAVVGARLVRAESSAQALNPTQPYWGPNLSFELSFLLVSRWFVSLAGSGSALWPRDRFTYADPSGRSSSIFSPSRTSGSIALGAGVRL